MKKITTWIPTNDNDDDFGREDVRIDESEATAITETLLQIGEIL